MEATLFKDLVEQDNIENPKELLNINVAHPKVYEGVCNFFGNREAEVKHQYNQPEYETKDVVSKIANTFCQDGKMAEAESFRRFIRSSIYQDSIYELRTTEERTPELVCRTTIFGALSTNLVSNIKITDGERISYTVREFPEPSRVFSERDTLKQVIDTKIDLLQDFSKSEPEFAYTPESREKDALKIIKFNVE